MYYIDLYIDYITATLVQSSQCSSDGTTNAVLQCSVDAYKKYCGDKISTDMECIVKKSICPLAAAGRITLSATIIYLAVVLFGGHY